MACSERDWRHYHKTSPCLSYAQDGVKLWKSQNSYAYRLFRRAYTQQFANVRNTTSHCSNKYTSNMAAFAVIDRMTSLSPRVILVHHFLKTGPLKHVDQFSKCNYAPETILPVIFLADVCYRAVALATFSCFHGNCAADSRPMPNRQCNNDNLRSVQ